MPEYRCIEMCFHSVKMGVGRKHKLFRIGDIIHFDEGEDVPDHFVLNERYIEPADPRLSGDTAGGSRQQLFPSVRAPEKPEVLKKHYVDKAKASDDRVSDKASSDKGKSEILLK